MTGGGSAYTAARVEAYGLAELRGLMSHVSFSSVGFQLIEPDGCCLGIDAETLILVHASHCDHRNGDSSLIMFIRCTHMFPLLRRNLHVTVQKKQVNI